MKYGAEGYAVYWFCLELIAGDLDGTKANFELSHDAEVIGYDLKIDQLRVQEIMKYMINLGLFETNNSRITCLKIAKFIDKKSTRNPEIHAIIDAVNSLESAEMSRTDADKSETVAARLDETRLDKENTSMPAKQPKEQKFSDEDVLFAEWMHSTLLKEYPDMKTPNINSWANTIRLMRERDDRDYNQMADTWNWARQDSFWKSNILSAAKFREKFDQLNAKRKSEQENEKTKPGNTRLSKAERVAAAIEQSRAERASQHQDY